QEDSQRLAVDPRALVRLRRAVMVVLGGGRDGCALHQPSPPSVAPAAPTGSGGSGTGAPPSPDSTCSTGLFVRARTSSISPSSSHFDCSPASVEIRISSI